MTNNLQGQNPLDKGCYFCSSGNEIVEAIDYCVECDKNLCPNCVQKYNEETLCEPCLTEIEDEERIERGHS